jgi:Zn-dependent protease with chaperone function
MAQSPTCGRCRSKLLPGYAEPLERLDPRCYVHDLDRQALEALHQIPGVRTLLRTLMKKSVELAWRLFHQANFVKVTERQIPQLKVLYEQAAHSLGVLDLPDLYVSQDPTVKATTYGVEKAVIAVSSGTLDLMDDRELLAVLGHELGHWQCNHVLYRTAAVLVGQLAGSVVTRMTLGLGDLALLPIRLALLRWYRASELTSDRAALLTVREPQVVLRMLMKLAGGSQKIYEQMDFEAFLAQAEEFDQVKDEALVGRWWYYLDSLFATHPYPMWRASELVHWIERGPYLAILRGEYPQLSRNRVGICSACGQAAVSGAQLCDACLAKEEEPVTDPEMDAKDKSGNPWDKTMKRFREFFDA